VTSTLVTPSTTATTVTEGPDVAYRSDVYAAARHALDELTSLVETGDREGFREALTAAREAVGEEA